MALRPLRLLFNAWADGANVNAQNLNARAIAVRLDPERFRVAMYCRRDPDPQVAAAPHVDLIRMPSRLGTLVQLRHLLSRRYDLLFYTRLSRADSVHRWLKRAGLAGTPLVSPVENVLDGLAGLPGIARRYWRALAAVSDVAVANAPHVARTYRTAFGRDVPVIPSGVDTALVRQTAGEERGGRPAGVTVAFAGTFQERKHPELVVEAARVFPACRFVLMGSGPLEGELRRRIREYGLENVSIEPTRGYDAYLRKLALADIFLFPSRVEGLPRVTLEAAAAGIPVIVFDDYRTPSVVDGETGYQVRTFEVMVERLGCLVADPGLRTRMGEAGASWARRFDWEAIVPRWEALFEEVAAGRGRRP